MDLQQQCIRKKVSSASCRDQLIAIAIYARYKHPNTVLLTFDESQALFNEFKLPYDPNEIERWLRSNQNNGFSVDKIRNGFSVDDNLLASHEPKYRECLPLTFAGRLSAARQSFRNSLEQRAPKFLAPALEIAGVLAVFVTIFMGGYWVFGLLRGQ